MKVYISGCTKEDSRLIKQTADLLKSTKHQPFFHNMGQGYSPEPLEQADAVVFVLPGGNFPMPSGANGTRQLERVNLLP